MNFIRAAEAVGLGCCPISVIRNHIDEVAELLELPDFVFPVAGMTAGYPSEDGYLVSAATSSECSYKFI